MRLACAVLRYTLNRRSRTILFYISGCRSEPPDTSPPTSSTSRTWGCTAARSASTLIGVQRRHRKAQTGAHLPRMLIAAARSRVSQRAEHRRRRDGGSATAARTQRERRRASLLVQIEVVLARAGALTVPPLVHSSTAAWKVQLERPTGSSSGAGRPGVSERVTGESEKHIRYACVPEYMYGRYGRDGNAYMC